MSYDMAQRLRQIDEVIARGPYKATPQSLSRHETPKWFKDAGLGIFIHWGIYSVPAFDSEWYSRNMYIQGHKAYEHHIKTYGAHKDFGYKDFLPMFKAERFDADEWAQLFKKAGARFAVPVAEHHDGFQMYNSELSEWNALCKGPGRDVFGMLQEAFKREGLIGGGSTHRIEHWWFMGHGREFESDITDSEEWGDFYWPAHREPEDHFDLTPADPPDELFLNDWMIRTCELIDRYHIRELYFDWWIQIAAARPYLMKIAAYYYNRAAEWGEEVLIAYKHDAFPFGTAVVDVERGQFDTVQSFAWQTDTAIAKNSWCYTEGNDFKKPWSILCDLVDVVSKNGTMLLNVGPRADGTICDEDRAILLEIGAWLSVNGEAIYGSVPWRVAGEGPTVYGGGFFSDGADKVYTSADWRFTAANGNIYAIALRPSPDGHYSIESLGAGESDTHKPFSGMIHDVYVLTGATTGAVRCEWERAAGALGLTLPAKAYDALSDSSRPAGYDASLCPVVFRIETD